MGIMAVPMLVDGGGTQNWVVRKIEAAEKVKVASVGVSDLTAKQEIINSRPIEVAEYFDDFNVMELTYVARHDNINTQNEKYAPMKVLPSINQKYDPQNIIGLDAALPYINLFEYDIKAYVPDVGSGTNGEYVNLVDGDIVIDVVKVNLERVEVDFLGFENLFDDTIYT